MNRRLSFACILMAMGWSLLTNAQTPQLPNAGFETWTGSGASIEPQDWNSTKSAGGSSGAFAPQTLWRENTNPFSGTSCARVESVSYFGQTVNGALTTGRVMAPSTNKAEGYIVSNPSSTGFFVAFNGRPDSLVGYYRYTKTGSDQPKVSAILHDGLTHDPGAPVNNNHPDTRANEIAKAIFTGPSVTISGWTRFSVPFNYNGDTRIPTGILVNATSSADQNGGSAGSKLWLDDLQLVYNPSLNLGTVATGPYYISNTAGASIQVPFVLAGTIPNGNVVEAELSDATGSFANPTVIGNLSTTTSGTINATIPAGTPAGSQYRIRVKSAATNLTSADNGADIQIILVSASIAPTTTQTIVFNTNGTPLSYTETPASTQFEWKFATVSGGPYQSFSLAQNGASYTPNFANGGTYYVVAEYTYPGLTGVTNEVQINVLSNPVTPAAPQQILLNTNGNTLTTNESGTVTAREWKYAFNSGGPYQSFTVPEVNTTYTPNFNSNGVFYVICESNFGGTLVTSNEVQIIVGNYLLNTTSVTGFPAQISANSPAAVVSVDYTINTPLNAGNIFTAQLSDANGSFISPTTIGTLTSDVSGTIACSIPNTTPAGSGYRIRVVANDPAVIGFDNGANLIVDRYNNSISPNTPVTVLYNTPAPSMSVTESQATTSRNWKYTTTSGSNYTAFTPALTGQSETPVFAAPGTYYLVCVSTNTYGDTTVSNEVMYTVTNGSQLSAGLVSNAPFYVSPNANEQVTVPINTDVYYNSGNVFTLELSDENGSFATPTVIGTLASSTATSITGTIPPLANTGNAYRVRVTSSDPAIVGGDNGADFDVYQFEVTIAPGTQQNIAPNTNGTPITATENHPGVTRNWKASSIPGSGYQNLTPAETGTVYTPNFSTPGTRFMIVESVNSNQDTVVSGEVVIVVFDNTGIEEAGNAQVIAYFTQSDLVFNLTQSTLVSPDIEIYDMRGVLIWKGNTQGVSEFRIPVQISKGIYSFRITEKSRVVTGRVVK